MKQLSIFNIDVPYDFINIGIRRTGINGIFRCITKISDCKCYTTYYPNINITNETIIISIGGNIISDTTNTDDIIKNNVCDFVVKNAKILQEYWNAGEYMDADYFLDNIRSI
jgi:hypothetical protein